MGFLEWLSKTWTEITLKYTIMGRTAMPYLPAQLETQYKALPESARNDPDIKAQYEANKALLAAVERDGLNPLKGFISAALNNWLKTIKKYETKDPAKVTENLIDMTTDIVGLAATAAAIDTALGMLPNGAGTASTANTKQVLAWLGVGAVVTAVAHDPVKIGLLRPYQDSLEATFRNRRPGDIALFQAYRTRELSPIKIDDLSKLTDTEMNRVETDNQTVYDREIAKWGYSEWFATALSRSATRTLGFSQLVTLARAGIYDKGLAIYSLWGEGLDRVVMPSALTALETLRDREMYSGFRSMIEPSYVDGDISEAELREYWSLSGVPDKVSSWVILRLRKRREATLAKKQGGVQQKEKDLTVSQITQAYQAALIKRVDAFNSITAMGYSQAETDIILDLAETRIKVGGAKALQRLPLSDYEKAYKAKLISLEAVLQRMTGEYDSRDIELERQLLVVGKA